MGTNELKVIEGGNNPMEVISKEDANFVNSLPQVFPGLQLGMSGFQIKYGVLSNKEFPTPDSKYWQCVRELFARYEGVLASNYNYLKNQLEVEKLEAEKELCPKTKIGDIELRMKELDIAFKKRQGEGMKLQADDTIRQMREFYKLLEENKKDMEFKTKEEAEPKYWEAKNRIARLGGANIMQIEDKGR